MKLVFSIIALGFLMSLVVLPNQAFADTTVSIPQGTSVPGCETTDECFIPWRIDIQGGETVTWKNNDSAAHTVTSGEPGSPDGVFDSSLFMAGTSFSHTFTDRGLYPYYCMVHPWMTGIILVDSDEVDEPKTPPPFEPIRTTKVKVPQGTSVPGCEETNQCFTPWIILIDTGNTVTWNNIDSAAHTVTSGLPGSPDGVFDSSLFMAGTSFSHTFTDRGLYPYYCMVHPWMEGRVMVEGDSSPEPVQSDVTPPKILQPQDIEINAESSDGARATFDVLVIDETDEIVRPSCNPSSGSFFAVGQTRVTCSAKDSAGNSASQISFIVTVNPPGTSIPGWVKNVAEFWCEDKIDDGSFVEGIQYLIDNGIIVVPVSSQGGGSSYDIPSWIKNNACWWSQGAITDDDFAKGIEFLVKEGIIKV